MTDQTTTDRQLQPAVRFGVEKNPKKHQPVFPAVILMSVIKLARGNADVLLEHPQSISPCENLKEQV